MRCLELFCGSKSVGKVLEAHGWEVISVDIDPETKPTICCSIVDIPLDKWSPGYFDYVHASPPCTAWSQARTTGPPIDWEAEKLISLHMMALINHLKPTAWTVENPATSKIWKLPWLCDLPFVTASYCQYSNWGYRKNTRFACNLDWHPKVCKNDCVHVVQNAMGRFRHKSTAQRGSRDDDDKFFSRKDLYRIPELLCENMLQAVLCKVATVR